MLREEVVGGVGALVGEEVRGEVREEVIGRVGALVGEEVGGGVGAKGVRSPTTLSRPLVPTLPVREEVGIAAARMAALICAAVAAGFRALYSTTKPVTCGVAIDVLLYDV